MPLVYIADDEPNIRRLVSFGLKDSGFESAEFADGEMLLAGVKARRPDAIILDWMMPPPDAFRSTLIVCSIGRKRLPEGCTSSFTYRTVQSFNSPVMP